MNTTAFARPEFRFASALPSAALTTVALLFGMHSLIKTDYQEPLDDNLITVAAFVMETPKAIKNIYEQPKKIDAAKQPPEAPPIMPLVIGPTIGVIPNITRVAPNKGSLKIGIGGGLLKQVMIAPVYPRRALSRGIEGFVDVAYDVTASGSTENLHVLYAEPEGVFEQSALAAVTKWKFRPQMIDEVPVPTTNLKERVRFTIEQ